MNIQSLDINDILLDESRFSLDGFLFGEEPLNGNLSQSLDRFGTLTPVIVYRDDNGRFHLIDGRKRIRFARRKGSNVIESAVLPQETDFTEIMALLFSEKRHVITETIINKIGFISFAVSLGLRESWIFESLCIPMRLKPHTEFLRECERIHALPEELKYFCHEKRFSLKQILNLAYYPEEILHQLTGWKSVLHLTASILDEIASNLRDYLKAGNKTVHDFASDPEVETIIVSHSTPRERTEKLRRLLYIKRYPVLSEVNAKIQKTVEKLDLPKEMTINWDRTLENRKVDISITVKDPKEWEEIMKRVTSSDIERALEKILDEL